MFTQVLGLQHKQTRLVPAYFYLMLLYTPTFMRLKKVIVNGNRNWLVVFLSRVHSTVLAPFALSENSIINSLNRFWVATGETPPLWFLISCYREPERRQNTRFIVIPQAERQRERQGWRRGKAPQRAHRVYGMTLTRTWMLSMCTLACTRRHIQFAHTPWSLLWWNNYRVSSPNRITLGGKFAGLKCYKMQCNVILSE